MTGVGARVHIISFYLTSWPLINTLCHTSNVSLEIVHKDSCFSLNLLNSPFIYVLNVTSSKYLQCQADLDQFLPGGIKLNMRWANSSEGCFDLA